jgi:hypothetical protein
LDDFRIARAISFQQLAIVLTCLSGGSTRLNHDD